MSGEVALGVGLDDHVALVVDGGNDRAVDLAHLRMVALNAAVEHADPRAGSVCLAPGPFARDLMRPAGWQADPLDCVGRQAPRRKFVGRGRACVCGHERDPIP